MIEEGNFNDLLVGTLEPGEDNMSTRRELINV